VDRPTYVNERNETVLLTPNEARLKNYSYMAHVFADVVVHYTEEGKAEPMVKEFKKTWLGEIPIMLHSDLCVLHNQPPDVLRTLGECIYDQGGYFIIDGKEKVIVSQERITTNRLFIEATPKDQNFSHRGHIHCTGERGETMLSPRTITFYCIRRELPKSPSEDVKEDYRPYRGAILVSLPAIPGLFPLFTVFRLLGAESDQQILEAIFGDLESVPKPFLDFIYPSIRHGGMEGIFYQDDAIQHVAPNTYFKSAEQVHAILVNDLLPNMNPSPVRAASPDIYESNDYLYENKVKFLGHLVKDFIYSVMGVRPLSDRDGYVFKRVDISGFLLAQLFQSAYIQVKNTCRDMLDAHYHYIIKNKGQLAKLITPENIRKFLQPTILSEMMLRSLKGRWGAKPEDPDQEVIQDLGRISYIQYLSHVRRVNLPLDRSIKLTSPHRLHSQQWGIMCPFESPDGASIGYLKNFALLSHVTFGTDSDILYPEWCPWYPSCPKIPITRPRQVFI
jgi:DNA-directed RNA polymerase II subunit RPB2